MLSGRGAGAPTSSGGAGRLDVPRVVVATLDPRPADADRARTRQPTDLGRMARAEDEEVEPVGAGDEGVLVVVRPVDHAVAGAHLVHLTVLPGESRAGQD